MSSKPSGKSAKQVEEEISGNTLVMFSKTWCPFCSRAKALFKSIGANVHVLEIDLLPNEQEIQDALLAKCGKRSVPSIWLSGEWLGGCDDVVALNAQEKLLPRLKEAGAA